VFKYQEVGKILKPYQSKGHLIALILEPYADDVLNSKALFLDIDGLNIPFFIEEIEVNEDLFTIKFEEFTNPEDIKKHNGLKISLRHIDIDWDNKKDIDSIEDSKFLNYQICDTSTNTSYNIKNIEQFPHQLMAQVYSVKDTNEEYEIFIPLIEEFIEDIDDENNVINMKLPEGLVS